MRTIILLLAFMFIGTVSFAQKDNNAKENKGKDQDTKITPGASGVKRSIGYRFSSVIDVSDPGNGVFRYNNKNISSVTYIIVDKNDIKGEDQTNWYETWDKTTGATGRGRLTLVALKGDNVNVFDVTDVFIDGNGFWKFPVEYVSGTLPQNDSVYYYVFERIAHSGGGEGKEKDKDKVEGVEEVEEVEAVEVVEGVEEVEEVEAVEVVEGVEEAPVVVAEEPVVAAAEPVVEEPVAEEVEAVEEVEPSFAEASEDREVEEAPVVEAAPAVVVAEVPAAIEEAPPIVVNEAPAEVVEEPVTKPQQVTKLTPIDQETKTKPVVQPGEVTKEAPVTPETITKPVTQPTQERVTKPVATVTETKPVIKPDQETRTVPATQPAQATQTTVGTGRRTITSEKPATQPSQETKTTTVARETRTVPATRPSQPTQTKPTIQPAPTPERKPLPEPEQGPPAQIALQPVQETQKEPVTQPAPEKKYDDFPVVQNYYESSGGRSHGKCYRGIIEIGYALQVSEYGMNNFRFNFINGFNIKNTSIGLGIGVRKYFDKPANHPDWHLVSSDVQIPVFLDIRTRFSSKTLTPYLGIGLGGSQGLDSDTTNNKPEGLYFHATGGIWFNISDRFAIFGGFAYEMQKLQYANFSDEIPYKKNTNSISINVGIAF